MLNFVEREPYELLKNLLPHEGLLFPRHHRLRTVERGEGVSVGIESLVVVVDELVWTGPRVSPTYE